MIKADAGKPAVSATEAVTVLQKINARAGGFVNDGTDSAVTAVSA